MGKKQKNGRVVFDQASALPYRVRTGRIEFCLITSMGKRRWCFPKGVIDPGETPPETALKEAEEEAGLQGAICGESLGDYEYFKWGRMLNVVVWLMEVREVASRWEERAQRDRQWVDSEEASRLLRGGRLQPFVQKAIKRLHNGAP